MRLDSVAAFIAGQPWAVSVERLELYQDLVRAHAQGRGLDLTELRALYLEEQERAAAPPDTGVGVVPIYGDLVQRSSPIAELLGFGCSMQRIAATFRKMLADPAVGSIVLDVHSYGGTVFGAHELHVALREGRGKGKRIVAVVNSMAASAAYWAACAADEVVITPGGEAGSIGVYTVHLDVSEALAKQGIKPTIIKAGKNKAENEPVVPLTDEARKAIQARADAAYELFVGDVAAARGATPAAVRNGYGQGGVLAAKAAKAAGLVDRIATFEETVQRLLGRKARATASSRAADGAPELRAQDGEGDDVPLPVPDVEAEPAPPATEQPPATEPEQPAAAAPNGDLELRRRALDLA